MRLKTLVTTLLAASLLSPGLGAAPTGNGRTWQQAMRLYGNGMYEQARILFASLPDDPLSDAYEVLCALKMQTEKVLLVGEEFAKAYKELYSKKSAGIKAAKDKTEVLLFQDTPALVTYLEKNPLKDKTILIKGSHSIGLEKTFSLL